jgi:phage tail sheath protein FI
MAEYLSPGVYVEEIPSAVQPITGVSTSTAGFIGILPESLRVPKLDAFYRYQFDTVTPLAQPGEVKLCTSFRDFQKFFGGFSDNEQHNFLAHAVYGFFNNGGRRCYVIGAREESIITENFLEQTFAVIDEIAIVAAPGITNKAVWNSIVTHCKIRTGERFAIFDSPREVEDDDGILNLLLLNPPSEDNDESVLPDNSDYAAFYFPWIQVADPVKKTQEPNSDGRIYVPPSGHIAGIYARVDTSRGVYKAPANEVIQGALDLKYKISKNQQDGLNPQGVNCIRDINGNIRVWGARTIGGDANGEWKYINVRRLLLFLRESIDEGTQWAVFEPNNFDLWAKIRRNVSAFLTNVWRDGALFGNTPQEAFYVKCDEETNPPEIREQGQVVTEIGVAVVKPAEFVIFRITQWAGPQANN